MLDRLEASAELIAAAEAGVSGARQRTSPYAAHRAHVMALLVELDPGGDAEYLADALLAGLGADLFLHLRRDRGMPLERLRAGWERLARGTGAGS